MDLPSAPRPGASVARSFRAGDLRIVFQKVPPTISGDDLTYIHYAMTAFLKGRPVCSVALESVDLRSLAGSLGVSVKEVQRDYGVRGFLGPVSLAAYGNGEREDLGPAAVEMKDELVLPYLTEYLMDAIDCVDDLEPIA